MSAISIIGMPGNEELLSQLCKDDEYTIYGAQRLIEGLKNAHPWPRTLIESIPEIVQKNKDKHLILLASGDPLFYGIGTEIVQQYASTHTIRIYPALSSVTRACALLGWPTHSAPVLNLLQGDISALNLYAFSGHNFFVLLKNAQHMHEVCAFLASQDEQDRKVYCLSDLGLENQKYSVGTTKYPPHCDSNLVLIAVQAGKRKLFEDSFYQHDGQITKKTIRRLTVADLLPAPHTTLWDLGAGSGSIGLEWLHHCGLLSLGRAHRGKPKYSVGSSELYCVEKSAKRIAFIEENARRCGVYDATHISEGQLSVELLSTLADPDRIFFGGGLNHELWDYALSRLLPGGIMIAHGVTLETQNLLWALYERYKNTHRVELEQISLSHVRSLGRFHTFDPALPLIRLKLLG